MAIVRAVGKCKRTVDRWQERYVARGLALKGADPFLLYLASSEGSVPYLIEQMRRLRA